LTARLAELESRVAAVEQVLERAKRAAEKLLPLLKRFGVNLEL
jgi:hypothetical protein